ncbi:L-carnitine CoA-transferase [Enterobacillus tribolii]|uniref:L-carnitine CoA-transferase n=1 Tax=Enterobacillus tribolii TaxID=1487935 RepID=A0A370R3F5_9GAMM|nr:L-carnitine CoA-transferase [Enterobacillus tribolii]MBW7983657.1 L-carnitine CoA-transferase [Enterobacillus tribolii]RDK96585.1 L-carnitine CoA-transferase [Enterobacillus tribolii]
MSKKLHTPSFGILEGVRVVFSGIEVAGPFGPQMMAEWGAEVIWIENVAYDDTLRVQKNYCELDRRNQHSLSMNIFADEGREAFLKLMETTDILIESSKGPAFARRGITDELLWQRNKSLVIVHVSGYGQYGVDEYINLPSYDLIAQAFSGYLIQNGDRDQPIPAFPYTADYLAAFTVLSASLAALYRVQKTGEGESIDVAMYEVMLRIGQYYMMDYFNGGTLYPRSTKGKDPTQVGCGVYRCSDGFIGIELVGGKQVKSMLEELGMGHLLGTPDYPEGIPGIRADSPAAEELEAKLDAFFAAKTIAEAESVLAKFTIAAGKVMTIPELENHPQYLARENFIEWQAESGKTLKGPNVMPKFSRHPGKVWRAMPARGKDTADILSDLGYSPQEINMMREKGIIRISE